MDDESLYRLLDSIERRFDDLRDADREAVRVAHTDMSSRLSGFPQLFATKEEMETASDALQRLERDSVAREIYDTNHSALADLVTRLDRDKMSESVFQRFVEDYRIEQEAAATERRAVASALAASTDRQAGTQAGVLATWKQMALLLSMAATVVSLVVIGANYYIAQTHHANTPGPTKTTP